MQLFHLHIKISLIYNLILRRAFFSCSYNLILLILRSYNVLNISIMSYYALQYLNSGPPIIAKLSTSRAYAYSSSQFIHVNNIHILKIFGEIVLEYWLVCVGLSVSDCYRHSFSSVVILDNKNSIWYVLHVPWVYCKRANISQPILDHIVLSHFEAPFFMKGCHTCKKIWSHPSLFCASWIITNP